MPWRRAWQPTSVFLPGGSHGQRSLVGYNPWGHKESDTTDRLTLWLHTHTHIFHSSGFPSSSVGKESACNSEDPSSIPGLGRSSGEGIGYSLLYSWTSLVTQLVKNPPAMWETWVWSLGWEDPLRRERLPTPVFWPGEFHGLYSPWGHKESDMTERLSLSIHLWIDIVLFPHFVYGE